jgi:hypothetical protein
LSELGKTYTNANNDKAARGDLKRACFRHQRGAVDISDQSGRGFLIISHDLIAALFAKFRQHRRP